MIHQEILIVRTPGRCTTDLSTQIGAVVGRSQVRTGIAHVFVQHTSASLMLCENADPSVRRDLETFMARLAPDGAPWYAHDMEGPDDMPAHIRSVLTSNGLTLPVGEGRLLLGTWQGVYLWEHRQSSHQRRLVVTVQGEQH
ncbi:secondary thiamine-phosphate synthase enzyme YjbQ [Plasticicumulans sp.]|uniref:secondary thiamine-phosphate synthase enzyme YjbQ n=1 Tax=Plasticicumulans sp. TaxID=2307179 RepID=UPI002CCFB293|nr:secondary thiamine-phosphate synthase enzyme YjbQ [Plasticicumulans sp.]MBS0601082.1 YjbQ family protein [Pseudomonadota bacterium]HMW30545.1 secondary thiamine-phosphate synthase enzyme YjbQ [Plasticicumulans sp.]HMW42104.1 secondary thiamine-phosphate synthase enzyme YjbQ [Plasticicumulans sp.]HMX52867.1 secondary thiamine-phosphate synthase enzyme YjbQ [Plasticicumulans sp.]HMZ10788.1 secondary thiamine-phosphate synthase enzyme YjbQ [Plasticicumulans sp.]